MNPNNELAALVAFKMHSHESKAPLFVSKECIHGIIQGEGASCSPGTELSALLKVYLQETMLPSTRMHHQHTTAADITYQSCTLSYSSVERDMKTEVHLRRFIRADLCNSQVTSDGINSRKPEEKSG